MPDVFDRFIGGELESVSQVGRKAYVSSLKNGAVLEKKGKDITYTMEDGWLVSTNHRELFAFVEYDEIELRLKPKDGATVEITNDNQVDSDTKYKD